MSKNPAVILNFGGGLRQCLSDLVYGIFKGSLRAILPVFFHMRVVGLENCPPGGGPLVVISNHLGEWDPPIMGSHLPWQVHWLAKVELFELLGGRMNGFFRGLKTSPVSRARASSSAPRASSTLNKAREYGASLAMLRARS